MPSAGSEPVTPATKRPQTYALDRVVIEMSLACCFIVPWISFSFRLQTTNMCSYAFKLLMKERIN
jgi:hypothetical protein